MPHDANAEEPVIPDDLFTLNGDELLRRFSRPCAGQRAPGGDGGAAGLADWIGKAVDGAKSLVEPRHVLSDEEPRGRRRAKRRVRHAAPDSRRAPRRRSDTRSAFISSATASAVASSPRRPPGRRVRRRCRSNSLSLLQAAFSHYGFAQSIRRHARRLLPSRGHGSRARPRCDSSSRFTAKDKAVGLAYPIASRLARQIASALGDANDPYGGLGRNGAQKTPDAQVVTLRASPARVHVRSARRSTISMPTRSSVATPISPTTRWRGRF